MSVYVEWNTEAVVSDQLLGDMSSDQCGHLTLNLDVVCFGLEQLLSDHSLLAGDFKRYTLEHFGDVIECDLVLSFLLSSFFVLLLVAEHPFHNTTRTDLFLSGGLATECVEFRSYEHALCFFLTYVVPHL